MRVKAALRPRPLSVWLEPIEVGVAVTLIASVTVLIFMLKINKRLRRVERLVTSL